MKSTLSTTLLVAITLLLPLASSLPHISSRQGAQFLYDPNKDYPFSLVCEEYSILNPRENNEYILYANCIDLDSRASKQMINLSACLKNENGNLMLGVNGYMNASCRNCHMRPEMIGISPILLCDCEDAERRWGPSMSDLNGIFTARPSDLKLRCKDSGNGPVSVDYVP